MPKSVVVVVWGPGVVERERKKEKEERRKKVGREKGLTKAVGMVSSWLRIGNNTNSVQICALRYAWLQ